MKKLYVLACLIIALNIAFYLTPKYVDLNIWEHMWLSMYNLGIAIILGVFGNRWRERNLVSRGYRYQSTAKASDDQDAISLYFRSIERSGT